MCTYQQLAHVIYVCIYVCIYAKSASKSNVDPRHEPSVWGKVLTSTMCAGAALLHLFQSNTLLLPNLNVLNGSTLIAV